MVHLRVRRAFSHEGRAFTAGDIITVTPVEAVALHRRGLVSLSRVQRKDLAPAPSVPDAPPAPVRRPRAKRVYRRKDMVAEA